MSHAENQHGSPDAYVVWHSPAGHHGLHGPYPHDTAQTLKTFAPGAAHVVVGTLGATDRYLMAEAVLTYNAPKSNSYFIALVAKGIAHRHTDSYSATHRALTHVVDELLEEHGPVLDLTVLVDAVLDAGFTKQRTV